ncbi:TetR/AcrR family transcriptional regulator [Cribrihabitans pelagius]|uniref:TetR/AcrR family transcriptional regulator n=1 Tax=Cribrihabitans pelagius TaxID=1765746 RepID=UPI003B59BBB7
MPHPPRKQARQARAKATEAAILEGAARILETGGAAALTTNAIAARSGVSNGSLYQYYPNKQAIVAALLQRERQALLAAVQAVTRAEDVAAAPRETLQALIGVAVAHQFTRPRLALELEHLERGLDLDDEMAGLAAGLAAEAETVVRACHPALDSAAARDAVTLCRALANAAAFEQHSTPEAIHERAACAVFGYLDARARPAAAIPGSG